MLKGLRGRFRCIAPDFPGFGLSGAAKGYGFSVALRMPERIRGFIIGNIWAWPLERLGQKVFSRSMGGLIGRVLAWCCNGVVVFFMSKGVATGLEKRLLNMYLSLFRKRQARAPTNIFPNQLRAARAFLAEIYKGLPILSDKPALILWGEKDFAFQTPERLRFERLFSNHVTVMLPNAGHFIQEDSPDEIVAAIRRWFFHTRAGKVNESVEKQVDDEWRNENEIGQPSNCAMVSQAGEKIQGKYLSRSGSKNRRRLVENSLC
ncbi:MAG TPA: alpha/beta fold hydrolase [Desulfobulbus sp.]|nr:alpha/beta fold hydrolase [Desulfobulbus sp.]